MNFSFLGKSSSPPKRGTVFQESLEMMTGSLIIYLFADIRELARNDELSVSLEDLEPPLTSQQMLEAIKGNEAVLEEKAINSEELEKRLSALKTLQSNEGSMFNLLFGESVKMPKVTHFCDRNSEKEVVHAIVVNEARKRVTVIFRGSVTQQDFIQDAKCSQKKVDNPVFPLVNDKEILPEQIRLHTGFYEYLQKKNPETDKTRLEEIYDQLKEVFQGLDEGYELYVSGHSLGGALCTMFGFYAASNDEIWALTKGPIVVYSVASPYVGNWKFRTSFQELERARRIQHLRIANLEDMVTNMPFAAPKLTALSPILSAFQGAGNLYKHVGIRLQFTEEEDTPFTLFYPKDQSDDEEYTKEIGEAIKSGKSLLKSFFHIMTNDVDKIVKHHSCEEYEARLQKCREALDNRTLDDLYADQSLMGQMMDKDYQPKQVKLNGYQRAARAWGAMRTNSNNSSSSNLKVANDEEKET